MSDFFNKIIHGDCLEVMDTLPDEMFKVIVTSPPYNLKNSTGGGMANKGGFWPNAKLREGYSDHDDNMPRADYVEWQRECLSEMFRLLRPDGAIFYNHKWRVQDGLIQDCSDIMAGFSVRQIIIWHRPGSLNFNDGYFLPNYEVIYLIATPDFKLIPNANAVGSVWKINHETNNPHPAPFPLELASACLRAVGDGPVLDPFMGSGTTACAAEQLGREWLGIEKSESYIGMAEERLKHVTRQLVF